MHADFCLSADIKSLLTKKRALYFTNFIEYDILASFMEKTKLIKFAISVKEQMAILETQFQSVILSQVTYTQEEAEEIESAQII